MKNKSYLLLLEQMCMILVFALAAALTLQGFALSGEMIRESRTLESASLAAQNMAEILKQSEGDLACAAEMLGGTADSAARRVICTDEENRFTLTAELTDTDNPLLGAALIRAEAADGGTIYSLRVCWQRRDPLET